MRSLKTRKRTKPIVRTTLRAIRPACCKGVRRRKARWSLFVVRLALRSQRWVALGGREPASDCERRRHEGEELERRDCEDQGSLESSMGRARERAALE